MTRAWSTLAVALAILIPRAEALAADATPPRELRRFHEIFKELVETNTTNSSGSCTVAAEAMARRLKQAGYADGDMQLIVPPDAPTKGNLVVRLKGNGEKRPLLLVAHLDVVEAKREDWVRDPFKLIEENGVYYGRGTSDDKSQVATHVSNLIRYKEEKLVPKRDIIMALTCDEEIIPSK
ncbi:M20/M25/M40 family metallo-hydrolase [Roseateles sp. UC29_93]|uniref:M20/M25/M40 family metallo-hydrolase n=1 Tax=Roseateles sp. UC29_93 TaxID=3350177 RepID=UPI00366E6E57